MRCPKAKAVKDGTYKVVCVSLYQEDLERVERLVEKFKRRGHANACRSAVIRAALEQLENTNFVPIVLRGSGKGRRT